MFGLIFIIFVSIVIFAIYKSSNRTESLFAEQKKRSEDFIRDFAKGKLPPVQSPLILKLGEKVYFSEKPVTLYEARASSVGFGVGTKIGHIYLGSQKSESRDEVKRIDEGYLTITNRRLAFSGRTEQRTLPVKEIQDIVGHLDYFSISSENRDRKLLFQVKNPTLWQVLIRNSINGNLEKALREGIED